MFQRDYIMRILQAFFKDLDVLIHGKHYPDDEQQLEAIGDLYREYLKNDRTNFYDAPTESLLVAFGEDTDGIFKAEMLATLLYQDALLQTNDTLRKTLLKKVWLCINISTRNRKIFRWNGKTPLKQSKNYCNSFIS